MSLAFCQSLFVVIMNPGRVICVQFFWAQADLRQRSAGAKRRKTSALPWRTGQGGLRKGSLKTASKWGS